MCEGMNLIESNYPVSLQQGFLQSQLKLNTKFERIGYTMYNSGPKAQTCLGARQEQDVGKTGDCAGGCAVVSLALTQLNVSLL